MNRKDALNIRYRGPKEETQYSDVRVNCTGAANKSALFWKQRRNDLPVEWKKLSINTTTIVGVLS